MNADSLLVLFVLAVLANVAYCAAYIVDVVAQISAFRSTWLRIRWMLLGLGVLFAGVRAVSHKLHFTRSTSCAITAIAYRACRLLSRKQ
jgi:hypothetical protein